MISIIVCSKFPTLSKELLDNISQTVGTDYEIVSIDNSQAKYSIFEAYNEGVARSKGEYLCFMHEDVVLRSSNWGNTVERVLSHKDVGAIGVAGGCVASSRIDWRFSNYHWGCLNLVQGTSTVEPEPYYYTFMQSHFPKAIKDRELLPVAMLDGVWMAMRRDIFNTIRFDSETFAGFHLYDSDICMQINKLGKDIYVVKDILLEHKSEGTFSAQFATSQKVFLNKWKDMLPLVKGLVVSPQAISHDDEEAIHEFNLRLEKDRKFMELKSLFDLINEGKPCRKFTREEKTVVSMSQFHCCKSIIKNADYSQHEALALLRKTLASPYQMRKGKLVMKFFWYRILGIRVRHRHVVWRKYNLIRKPKTLVSYLYANSLNFVRARAS